MTGTALVRPTHTHSICLITEETSKVCVFMGINIDTITIKHNEMIFNLTATSNH